MLEIIDALEQMFREKGEGRVEMPPKPGIYPMPESFIHAMPAHIPALKAAGVKWVSAYPANFRRGLPYITGLIVLNDPETGLPLSVMDCVWVTAKRTGAATAVAARHLARPDSEVVGVLGCGVQGRSNLEALMELFAIKRVMAYDINPDVQRSYSDEMAHRYGIVAIPVHEPREAVAWCDIVVTAGPITKVPHGTIQPEWFKPGTFASLVDFDSYWSRNALRLADKFCTDDVPQLDYYKELGYFEDIPPVYAELGELVAGQRPGRQSDTERTVACNLGLALDDMATAPLIYRRAAERGIGTWLPL
jgi:ornithine cyclodeaminase/alanine dehydrogenase-like protein (mu-crystallin family)